MVFGRSSMGNLGTSSPSAATGSWGSSASAVRSMIRCFLGERRFFAVFSFAFGVEAGERVEEEGEGRGRGRKKTKTEKITLPLFRRLSTAPAPLPLRSPFRSLFLPSALSLSLSPLPPPPTDGGHDRLQARPQAGRRREPVRDISRRMRESFFLNCSFVADVEISNRVRPLEFAVIQLSLSLPLSLSLSLPHARPVDTHTRS